MASGYFHSWPLVRSMLNRMAAATCNAVQTITSKRSSPALVTLSSHGSWMVFSRLCPTMRVATIVRSLDCFQVIVGPNSLVSGWTLFKKT